MPMSRVSSSSERSSEVTVRCDRGGRSPPSTSRDKVAWVMTPRSGAGVEGGRRPPYPIPLGADSDTAGWNALAQGGFGDPTRVENDVEVTHVDRLRREQDGAQRVVAR